MRLNCENCGKKINYKGICYKCAAEKKRIELENYSNQEVLDKILYYKENINLNTVHELICLMVVKPDFDYSLCVKAAYSKEIYYPYSIYLNADYLTDDILSKLAEIEYKPSQNAYGSKAIFINAALCCLAWIRSKKVISVFKQWLNNPPVWRNACHVDVNYYAREAGWMIDKTGNYKELFYKDSYQFLNNIYESNNESKIMKFNEKKCKCGAPIFDIIKLDLNDRKLNFIDADVTKIAVTACLNCLLENSILNLKYDSNGETTFFVNDYEPSDLSYEELYQEINNNSMRLSHNRVNTFYSSSYDELGNYNIVGGLPYFIQDNPYEKCLECKEYMKILAHIALEDFSIEGSIYIEICTDCKMITLVHQCT